MAHNLLYRIPDNIYQTFFCAKVVLNRLPTKINESPIVGDPDYRPTSTESANGYDSSFEYYLENKLPKTQSRNSCAGGIMMTRSALKKLNQELPTDCESETLDPIPKIVIKKKSKKVSGKIKAERASVERSTKAKSAKKSPTINYGKLQPKHKPSRNSVRKRAAKSLAPNIITQAIENPGNTTPCVSVAVTEPASSEQSTRTAETGYSSAADSTTNELLIKPTEDVNCKPILNYTLISKSKRGRKCCIDFVILPPTEPVTPSKIVPTPKIRRGRPRNIPGVSKPKATPKPKVAGVEKKTRKKYVRKSKLETAAAPPFQPPGQPVAPGKSLPIIEGPPNMVRAAWIKKQLMNEDFMCRIPLSKISRIPHVIKCKPKKPQINDKPPMKTVIPEPKNEPLQNILETATSDLAGATISDPSMDWFPQDLDLVSLNTSNYSDADMVLEDKYYPKNSSFTSTPCPDQSNNPIDNYMLEKLTTDTLPEISFGTSFFNYNQTGCSMVTPVKAPPLASETNIPEANDDRCIPITVNNVDAKTEITNCCFKRPFDRKLFQVTDEHVSSPGAEPLDLSIRTGLSQNLSLCNIEPKYAASLSPQSTDDVLLLDASYMGMDVSPRCNSNERFENFTMEPQRTKNEKVDALVSDMDALIREHEQHNSHNVSASHEPCSSNYFLNQDTARNSKILSELSKISRNIRLNEIEVPPQDDQPLELRAPPVVARKDHMPYNGNVALDETPLKRPVAKFFGFPCFRFLIGKCVSFPCKFNHQLIEPRVLQTTLALEPIIVVDKCYSLIVRYDMLFIKYFESFCILYGKRQMIPALILMINHCERIGRPIGFFRHIITGLTLCNLDKVQSYATLVQNIGPITKRSIDVLIEIMLELDVILKFTDKLEEFLKRDLYRLNIDLFERLLSVGKRTKDPELIRILLETINSYPSECQKRLNSIVLTQFLQMVRNLKSLQN